MIHKGIWGWQRLEEMSRSRCLPLGHICIFLENSGFWKVVAWFSLPLKGLGLGIVAAWWMTFILVA